MNDHVFIVCLLLLSVIGLMFSRYHWKHSQGTMHWAMLLLELSFVLVILYTLGVIFLGFPVINAREILLTFMGLVVMVLGITAADDWMDRIDAARKEAEAQEIIKMRQDYERRNGDRVV